MGLDEYILFTDKVKKLTSINLSDYKERQMKRRIENLMDRRGFKSLLSYYDFLAKDKTALDEFLDRITINVSEFFRNGERWHVLEQKVIAELRRHNPGTLKIWSAACSTGEEPYSLAMLMRASFQNVKYDLLATDIDLGVMARAKAAVYGRGQIEQIPKDFRARFLKEKEDSFTIKPEITGTVKFRLHNLLADPYPKGLDLIICRNVMIYFTDETKDKLYRQMAESLNPGGILFVGSTEQIFRPAEYGFRIFDSFFYQRI